MHARTAVQQDFIELGRVGCKLCGELYKLLIDMPAKYHCNRIRVWTICTIHYFNSETESTIDQLLLSLSAVYLIIMVALNAGPRNTYRIRMFQNILYAYTTHMVHQFMRTKNEREKKRNAYTISFILQRF